MSFKVAYCLKKQEGMLLRSSLREPGRVPEGKTHRSVGFHQRLGTLEIFSLKRGHTEPPAIPQLQLSFSYPAPAPTEISAPGFLFCR